MLWKRERRVKHQVRKVCAWCGIDMGPSLALEDSHGICPKCAEEFLEETREYRQEELQRRRR